MRKTMLALAALLASSSALAQTLISNVNGIQVGADGKLQHFGSIVIGDDGRVISVVKAPHPRLSKMDRMINGEGRTLLPGLIDAHGHVMGLGFSALQLDLVGTTSLADLQQRLKSYAAANPNSKWLIGRGWNQELWADKRFPTSADLDAIVADRPVVLERVDGHAIVANSAAMRASGVSMGTKAPSGGRIENGLFVDAATTLITDKVPAPDAATRDRAFAESQRQMLSVGLVGAADMGSSVDDWATFRRAGESGRLQVRIFSYASALPGWRGINGGRTTAWMFGDRLRLVGTKLYADGALGSRGAWLKMPYHDKPDTKGLSLIAPRELLRQATEVAAAGGQLATHAIGDAANDEVITAYEKLTARFGKARRWRIEHLQIADPKDLPRLKPAGIVASMQPTHQTSDRLMAEARLGPDRLEGAYAWQTIASMGVPLAFGSDFPVESPNPFPGLSAAVSRQDLNGQPPGGWRPQERVSFEQALAGFTRGAAYAGFGEKLFGSLEPGKWADFILVDRDVSQADPQALGRTQVLQTWVAGRKVWERGATGGGGERGR